MQGTDDANDANGGTQHVRIDIIPSLLRNLYNHDAYTTEQDYTISSSPALPELPTHFLVAFFWHTELGLLFPSSPSYPCEPNH